METIKVEQWIRTAYGLDKVIRIDDEIENTCGLLYLKEGTFYNFYTENGKVFLEDKVVYQTADTPQELIQVGDIVELENDAFTVKIEVINMRLKHLQSYHLEYNLDMYEITKIYTPNKDKTVYTEQWEQTKGA